MQKLFAILILFLIIPPSALLAQWDDCPYGKENSAYLGECDLYVDTNNDNVCDHSQQEVVESASAAETVEEHDEHDLITGRDLKTKSVFEIAQIYGIDAELFAKELSRVFGVELGSSDEFQLLHNDHDLAPNKIKDIAMAIAKNGEEGSQALTVDKDEHSEEETGTSSVYEEKKKYDFAPLIVLTLFAYFATFFLVKTKKIKFLTHKRIWNTILLFMFLVSGILGILLVIRINSGVMSSPPFDILYWHVETGIVMTIISFFHIFEHRRFYLNMVKAKKSD